MIKLITFTYQHGTFIKRAFTLIILLGLKFNAFGQSKENGINLGLTYPLSTLGVYSKEYSNIFSLNAIMALSREERAFTAAGVGNIISGNATGFQAAGVFNKIGGTAQGFQAAGVLNLYNDATGTQAAGVVNISSGNINGVQVAGFVNRSGNIRGFQGSGFINIADSVTGMQASDFINIANDVTGAQYAGFINIAKKVKGVQAAGFINIADSSEYPIGLVNIVKNGEKYIGVTIDDNLTTLATFRSGSKKLYGIIGLGYNFKNDDEVVAIQYGLGAHFLARNNFRLNVEGTVTHLTNFDDGDFTKSSLTVLPAFKISKRLEIFGGPSFNIVSTNTEEGRNLIDHYLSSNYSNSDSKRLYGAYIGYTAGVHLLF